MKSRKDTRKTHYAVSSGTLFRFASELLPILGLDSQLGVRAERELLLNQKRGFAIKRSRS